MQHVQRRCKSPKAASRSYGTSLGREKDPTKPGLSHCKDALARNQLHRRVDTKDGDAHWLPNEKIEFEKPLGKGSEPKRVVLKIGRRKGGDEEEEGEEPTPFNKKLIARARGPGSADTNAYRVLIEQLEKTPEKKFVDGTFDLSSQNCTKSAEIEWVRPTNLCAKPRLFPEDDEGHTDLSTKDHDVDIQQGNLGDCWLIATLAMIYAFDKSLLHNLLVEYRPKLGIVLCRFCKEGEWKYVVIDDRVPVVGSRMCYAHHKDRSLFWGAFLEKAYAYVCCS